MLISPCRDEASFADRCIHSVLRQTLRPLLWVIVDDGSSDGTQSILAKHASQVPWIRILERTDRGQRQVGPGVIEAFYHGLNSVNLSHFDYVCKFDLDLDIPPTYFEALVRRMEGEPRLGTCSGKPYFEHQGRLIPERCGDEMSVGMTKFYRVSCFKEIGGFVREVMWDGIDCHRCRMKDWIACSWDDPKIRFIHMRPMGSSQENILTGRQRHGFGQYFLGTGWLYLTLSALTRAFHPPLIWGALFIWWGYVKSAWNGHPRYQDPEFRRYLRSFQWRCIAFGKRATTHRIHTRIKGKYTSGTASPPVKE